MLRPLRRLVIAATGLTALALASLGAIGAPMFRQLLWGVPLSASLASVAVIGGSAIIGRAGRLPGSSELAGRAYLIPSLSVATVGVLTLLPGVVPAPPWSSPLLLALLIISAGAYYSTLREDASSSNSANNVPPFSSE